MGGGQDLRERGAVTAGAPGGIGVAGDDLETETFGPLSQLPFLVLGRLVFRGDADVAGRAGHFTAHWTAW